MPIDSNQIESEEEAEAIWRYSNDHDGRADYPTD